MIKKIFFTYSILLLSISFIEAQNSYKKNPVWIEMMESENTNYFEAIKAYDTYWTTHEKPNDEEGESMNENDGVNKIKEHGEKLSKRELKELEEYRWMRFQIKRFEHWKMEMLPYVQDDGSILTMDQRIKLWEEATGKSAK